MEIKVPGGSFNSKDLPPNVQRQILIGRIKRQSWIIKVALVSVVVDLTLRAIL